MNICVVRYVDTLRFLLVGWFCQALGGESRKAEEELAALKLKQKDVHAGVGISEAPAVTVGAGVAEGGAGSEVKAAELVEAEKEVSTRTIYSGVGAPILPIPGVCQPNLPALSRAPALLD